MRIWEDNSGDEGVCVCVVKPSIPKQAAVKPSFTPPASLQELYYFLWVLVVPKTYIDYIIHVHVGLIADDGICAAESMMDGQTEPFFIIRPTMSPQKVHYVYIHTTY